MNEYIESGIIEAYVLGMATGEEMNEMEARAVLHPEIWNAVDTFSSVIEAHALANAVTPDPAIKLTLLDFVNSAYKEEDASSLP